MKLFQTKDGWRLYLDLDVEPVRFWFSTNGYEYRPLLVKQISVLEYEVESPDLGKGTLTVGVSYSYLVLGEKRYDFRLCPNPMIPAWALKFVGKK